MPGVHDAGTQLDHALVEYAACCTLMELRAARSPWPSGCLTCGSFLHTLVLILVGSLKWFTVQLVKLPIGFAKGVPAIGSPCSSQLLCTGAVQLAKLSTGLVQSVCKVPAIRKTKHWDDVTTLLEMDALVHPFIMIILKSTLMLAGLFNFLAQLVKLPMHNFKDDVTAMRRRMKWVLERLNFLLGDIVDWGTLMLLFAVILMCMLMHFGFFKCCVAKIRYPGRPLRRSTKSYATSTRT